MRRFNDLYQVGVFHSAPHGATLTKARGRSSHEDVLRQVAPYPQHRTTVLRELLPHDFTFASFALDERSAVCFLLHFPWPPLYQNGTGLGPLLLATTIDPACAETVLGLSSAIRYA